MTNKHTAFDVFGNSLEIRQTSDDQSVRLQARRVKTQDRGEHVQMEIAVSKSTEKRTLTQYYSLSLNPVQTDLLIGALTNLHPEYTDETRNRPFPEERAFWRQFYKLPQRAA